MKKLILLLILVYILGFSYFKLTLSNNSSNEVNIYSTRKEKFLNDLIAEFQRDTGINVNILSDKAPKLIAKLRQEGGRSPADILITSDVINMQNAKFLGLLAKYKDDNLVSLVPADYRDRDFYWLGISVRKRLIFVHKNYPHLEQIKEYKDLANPVHNDALLVRSSSNPYNQALIAQFILHYGPEKTQQILNGITSNFAREPHGGDTDQLRALAQGEGQIALANNYYYERLKRSEDKIIQQFVKNIKVIYPNQDSYGININLSAIALLKNSKNKVAAKQFINFMLSKKAQDYFIGKNYEESVNFSPTIYRYKKDSVNVQNYHKHALQALEFADQAGWK